MNKFVFIVPFYNIINYITECAGSLLSQEYKNWQAIFIDDCSTDGSISKIPNDSRFTIIRNNQRLTALPNIHNAIINACLDDDDIICILDGDDKLINSDACTRLNNIYTHSDPLITYGQYVTSFGATGHCREYTPQTFATLRSGRHWNASHLRTFKYKLYKELLLQDESLNCYKDKAGEIYKMSYDVAIIIPLLEIAGFNKIKFNPIPIYYYRYHPNNDHSVNAGLQRSTAWEIFSKPKFKQVF